MNLNWLGYTIHDASTALRRYLNKLPEPVIPHAFYKDFRNVMSKYHFLGEPFFFVWIRCIVATPREQKVNFYYVNTLTLLGW